MIEKSINEGARKRQAKRQLWLSLISSCFGSFGSGIFAYGLSFRLYDETHSALSFSLSLVVYPFINLIVLPYVGPIVDRYSRKRVILLSQSFTILALGIFSFYSWLTTENVFLATLFVTICLAVSDSFTGTAQMASRTEVMAAEDLLIYTGYSQVMRTILSLLVAVLGALFYSVVPFVLFVLIEVLSECITFLITLVVRFDFAEATEVTQEKQQQTTAQSFREGVNYVRYQPYFLVVMFLSVISNGVGSITAVGIPIMVFQLAHASKLDYSLIEMVATSASLIGAWWVTKKKQQDSTSVHLMWRGILLIGGLLMAFGGIPWLFGGTTLLCFIGGLTFIIMGSASYASLPVNVWLQKEVPLKMQGRVFHLLNTISLSIAPLFTLLYGWLFSLKGLAVSTLSSGIFIVSGLTIFVSALLLPVIWHLDLRQAVIRKVPQERENLENKGTEKQLL